jgi:hypothetical protein
MDHRRLKETDGADDEPLAYHWVEMKYGVSVLVRMFEEIGN